MERNLCHYSSNKSSVLQINTICFAKKTRLSNKRKLICKYKTLFERKCRGMDKYVLCVTTVRLICLFMTKCDLIFSQMRAGRFSHMCSNRFSHKCVQADFLTCVQTDFLTNACRQIFSHVFKLIFSQMQSKQQMALLVNLRKTSVYLFKEYSRPTWVGNRWVSVLLFL